MAESVNPQITDAVSTDNVKTIAGAPAFYAQLAMGNAVSHQQAMNQILIAATGNITRRLTELDPAEAVSILKTATGSDVGALLANLLAVLSSGQEAVKTAQTTPPVTP